MKRPGSRIFVDMDGVLADFDTGYNALIGPRDGGKDSVDWSAVRACRDFYYHLPPMPDAMKLWGYLLPLEPTIITGVPSSVEEAPGNKRAWIQNWLGSVHADRAITCLSRDKSKHCEPGDILIDDWPKYKDLWEKAGGLWITHTSAVETIFRLRDLGL